MQDPLTEVLTLITPPVDGASWKGTDGIWPILYGATVSLHQCRRCIDRGERQQLIATGDARSQRTPLFEALERAIVRDTDYPWTDADETLVWTTGYLHNAAQQRVGAALDRCTNAWLAHLLGLERGTPIADDLWFSVYVGSRLALLDTLLKRGRPAAAASAQRLVGDFLAAQRASAACNTRDAEVWTTNLTERFGRSTIDEILSELPKHCMPRGEYDEASLAGPIPTMTDGACASFVFTRTSAVRHALKGVWSSSTMSRHRIEWPITARGLAFVARLWRSLIEYPD